MATTIKARFSNGILKPLESLDLREGEEVMVTVRPAPATTEGDWLEKSAGGWVGLVDGEKLKREVYESRVGGLL